MMDRLFRLVKLVATAFTAIILLACNSSSQSMKRKNMTELTPRLQAIFTNPKSACFGQYIIDVPATATLVYGPAHVEAPIRYYPGESRLIDDHLQTQLMTVEKDRKFLTEEDLKKFPLFGKIIDGAMSGQKFVFGSLEQIGYTIYSFIPIGEDLFVQSLDYTESKDDAIAELNKVAKNLRLRKPDEIPAEIGTCIDGGFVGFQPQYEMVTLGIRLKEFPDVHFSLEVLKNGQYVPEMSDLETRLKSAEKDGGNWYSRITFFRRGPRQIGDWNGDEALALKPAQEKEKESHEFHFISMGAPDALLQPRVDIQLDTGASGFRKGAVKPSLSDEEAVALWDKLISSIRVRPRGGNKTNVTPAPRTPLTTTLPIGYICPETGWWQCTATGEVEGGRRKHIAAGETLPQVIGLGEPTLWQKLTGERPRYKAASMWVLVEYDEVPPSNGNDHA